MHQSLHDRMIGGVEMIGDREVALAMTVKGLVARRRHNPIVPADVAEVNVERPSLTNVATVFSTMTSSSTRSAPRTIRVSDRALLVAPIVGVGEEERLSLRPALGTIFYASS